MIIQIDFYAAGRYHPVTVDADFWTIIRGLAALDDIRKGIRYPSLLTG